MAAERSAEAPTVESFATLYRTWRDFVKREASFVCRNDADADDVVQIVFLRLWDSRSWRTIRHPRSYFRGAARREAHRMGVGAERLPDAMEIADPSNGPFRRAVASEARIAMLEALEALPPRCGEVMTLTIRHGYSAAEVAAECDMSVGAVRKQRTRGGRLLQQWFEARGGAMVWLSTFQDGGG